MMVAAPVAKLLCAPRAGAEQDDEAWYGQTAAVLGAQGDYLRVRMSYGYESYMHRKDLIDGRYPADGAIYAVRGSFADVLRQARYQGEVLLTLPRGALLLSVKQEPPWHKVRLVSGEEGYVRCGLLEPVRRPGLEEPALRQQIVQSALGYLGVQYRWGGRTPWGIDCSGLCHAAYLLNGVAIYRNSRIEPGYPVREIPPERAGVGDLLYFPGHVALYLGEGRYVHATGRAGDDGVVVNSLDPKAKDYREDLAQSLLCAGSIFPVTG